MKRFRKIAGTPGSDGVNSCPTVIEMDGRQDIVLLQGIKIDAETRRELNIPEGEDAVIMPRDVYLRGAQQLSEDG